MKKSNMKVVQEIETESLITKVLKSQVGSLVSVISFLVLIFVPYFGIKQDIALIQKDISIINSNHEAHIQDILAQLQELKKDEIQIEKDLALTNQVLLDHIGEK